MPIKGMATERLTGGGYSSAVLRLFFGDRLRFQIEELTKSNALVVAQSPSNPATPSMTLIKALVVVDSGFNCF